MMLHQDHCAVPFNSEYPSRIDNFQKTVTELIDCDDFIISPMISHNQSCCTKGVDPFGKQYRFGGYFVEGRIFPGCSCRGGPDRLRSAKDLPCQCFAIDIPVVMIGANCDLGVSDKTEMKGGEGVESGSSHYCFTLNITRDYRPAVEDFSHAVPFLPRLLASATHHPQKNGLW